LKPGTVSLFVDESGNPEVHNRYGTDLLASGLTSNYFVLAAVRTEDPIGLRNAMTGCIAWADTQFGTGKGKAPVSELHARDDRPSLRTLVIQELTKQPIKAMAIAMDKRLLDPNKGWRTDRTRFYNEMAAYLLGDSLHTYDTTSILFSHKNQDSITDLKAMTKAISTRWAAVLRQTGAKPSMASANHKKCAQEPALYAADYVAWAVFRAFESVDLRYVNGLQPVLSHVWDLARLTHYTRRSPMKNPP
jgi:hypothetical protein